MKLLKKFGSVGAIALTITALPAAAQDLASCRTVRFADVGWSDIAATTGAASVVFEGLGYRPTTTIASIPITLAGIKNKQIDAFLGYWTPSMTSMIAPFIKAGRSKCWISRIWLAPNTR